MRRRAGTIGARVDGREEEGVSETEVGREGHAEAAANAERLHIELKPFFQELYY